MARSFGIELEGFGLTPAQAAAALQRVGIDARSESYNHATRTWWKLTTDASIQDDNGYQRVGFELVSPILYDTPETWATVKTILKVLRAKGAKVNRSCGFHVHIGVNDLSVGQFRNMIKKWVKYEDLIDRLMPVGRRASNAYFCQSNIPNVRNLCPESAEFKTAQKALFSRLDHATNIQEMIRVLHPSERMHETRYRKLNLTSYLLYGTAEFRQHSGTFDFDKVQNWVLFLLRFTDGAIKHSKVNPRFDTAAVENRLNTLLRGLHCGRLSRYFRKRYAELNTTGGTF